MNRPLSHDELAKQSIPTLTKRDKLMRFAKIVRDSTRRFFIFSNLERWNDHQLRTMSHDSSAFALAAVDPVLKDAGLKGQTPADAMNFFELRQAELHEFSCDCGGEITNGEMARRIEHLARST